MGQKRFRSRRVRSWMLWIDRNGYRWPINVIRGRKIKAMEKCNGWTAGREIVESQKVDRSRLELDLTPVLSTEGLDLTPVLSTEGLDLTPVLSTEGLDLTPD